MDLLPHIKIVKTRDLILSEREAISNGSDPIQFIEKIAIAFVSFLISKEIKAATVVAGKGNNGADGYAIAYHLIKAAIPVKVFSFYPSYEESPLCVKMRERYEREGGIVETSLPMDPLCDSVIIDALFGSGFHGRLDHPAMEWIHAMNQSHLPIFSVDIPSGLDSETGLVPDIAVKAHYTLYCGLPKWGFFVEKGPLHVGKLEAVFFDHVVESKVAPIAYLVDKKHLASAIRPLDLTVHKYSRGAVLLVGGDDGMAGALHLASLGAFYGGAGYVGAVYLAEKEPSLPIEVVSLSFDQFKGVIDPKYKALVIGIGLGRSEKAEFACETLLEQREDLPVVIDGDAIHFVAAMPDLDLQGAIITPHLGELSILLGEHFDKVPLQLVQRFVDERGAVVVVKGRPTWIFIPGSLPWVMMGGDPKMATAGSGDLLAGQIGALLAQGYLPDAAAILSVAMHAMAGERLSMKMRSFRASDLAYELGLPF